MLEYFSYKKVKKHREEKAAAEKQKLEKERLDKEKLEKEKEKKKGQENPAPSNPPASTSSPQIISTPADDDDKMAMEGTPVLDHEDEKFLERLTSPSGSLPPDASDSHEPRPPLPPRVKTPVMEIDSDSDNASAGAKAGKPAKSQGKGKEAQASEEHKPKRFAFSLRRKPKEGLQPNDAAAAHLAVPEEAHGEASAMAHLLDDLDLAAQNNRAFSLSAESAEMARRFTQVLRDVVNGVPTAYGDLVALIDDRDGVLARNFDRLPAGLKKLVAQLPDKLTSTLAPELLAAAAEAQGLEHKAEGDGLKDAAKKFLTPANLHELVTKPGALVGLLKGIVNALKTRFPAFIGTNVLWSLAVFLLLSMLWYCHKRGREVRLEREAGEAKAKDGDDGGDGRDRVEELPDDPMLAAPAPAPATSAAPEVVGARE